MITVSKYIAHLLSELAEARKSCDQESLRVAKLYSEDEIMRHLPVPRFKLTEVELTIPIAVSDTEMEDNISLAVSEQNFLYTVKKELDQQVSRSFGDVNVSSIGASNVYPIISDWYTSLSKCKSWSEYDRCFDQYFEKISGEIKDAAAQSQDFSTSVAAPPVSPVNLYEILKQRFRISQSLKNVLVDPQSDAVNRFSSGMPLIIVKAKMVEEGITVSQITDASGEKRYHVNFE